MEPILSIKDLSYSYAGGNSALRNISLEIGRGESVALLGSNGAGKSSLLLHLNGAIKSCGKVRINGELIEKKKKQELIKEIGLVFQDPDDQLFMPTVFDDVAFGPINMGLGKEEVVERVHSSLEKVGLGGYEDRLITQLSFGEKKRVSLATVLSMDPEIIALDEPTPNLDPRSRSQVMKVLSELKSKGKTIIIATHDIDTVPLFAEKVFVLNKEIIASGTPREIFNNIDLLKAQNLEVPTTAYLFDLLKCFGYPCDDLPLSIEEAVEHLTNTLASGEAHVHLHVHEHSHEQLRDVKGKHEHKHTH
jgi:cobalt/nickel transport system ATP-binding protein